MENTVPIYGNPAWSAQVLPDGMAFITITYPTGSNVAAYQTLRLPMNDLPELASCLNNLAAWKPLSHRGEEDAAVADEASDP